MKEEKIGGHIYFNFDGTNGLLFDVTKKELEWYEKVFSQTSFQGSYTIRDHKINLSAVKYIRFVKEIE